MKYLTLEEILWLHFQVVEDFGGAHGVCDENRLKSVIEAPAQAVFGAEQYPGLFEKAAVYLRNIIGDHPFADGNKRTAVTVCGIFLMHSGQKLSASPKQLEDFAVRVATERLDVSAIASWLEKHCQ
ncbi:MAG: type II toxin-antitoxin system death-on-curing family toxin [Candidatus Saccharimonadales bacterium]